MEQGVNAMNDWSDDTADFVPYDAEDDAATADAFGAGAVGPDDEEQSLEDIFVAAAAAVAAVQEVVAEQPRYLTSAETAVRPPQPIPVSDKTGTYLALPTFREFASLVTSYGELLCLRYGEVRLPADLQRLVTCFPDTLCLVAVVSDGDPDTAAVLPIVARLVDAGMRLDLRIVEDEDEESLHPLQVLLPNLDLIAALEEWDLPQVFVFDEEWEVQAQWGPRPAAADASVEEWLAAHPDYLALEEDESAAAVAAYNKLNDELLYTMRVWYNSGLSRACLEEWRELLAGLLPMDEPEADVER